MSLDISKLRRLDVYAILDSDTDEARAFTTYLGYWQALSELITDTYGSPPFDDLFAELDSRGLTRLAGKHAAHDPQLLRSVLLNAWSSELALYLVDMNNTARLWLANQWSQVYSYYATSRAASAWLLVRDGQAPDNHSGLLRAMSAQITNTTYYPEPWHLCCAALKPAAAYLNFPSPPQPVSNLAGTAPPHDRRAMMLRTTRDRDLKKLVEQEKRSLKRVRAPRGCFGRHDGRQTPTTVFNFTWRTRTRSNYGDPAMFYVGTLDATRSTAYASAMRTFTSATMFVLEALVAQKARKTLTDAAVHFMSRDRAQLSDQILLPRLQAIGLV